MPNSTLRYNHNHNIVITVTKKKREKEYDDIPHFKGDDNPCN